MNHNYAKKNHKWLIAICSLINNLGSSFTSGGKVELVLDNLVKELSFFRFIPVIATALLKHICNLLIGPPLASTNFPNFFKQFIKIIFSKSASIFEHSIIEYKSLNDKFAKSVSRPYPKMCSFD